MPVAAGRRIARIQQEKLIKPYIVMRILLMLISALMLNQAVAQEVYRVKRGERPPIDLESVPESAYHKGILKIKLNENHTRRLDASPVTVDARGIVQFGIDAIDRINERYQVSGFGKTFSSGAFRSEFEARHRAWGFHLWYTLHFDSTLDVKALVREYASVSDIEIAEPEYVKVPVHMAQPKGLPEGFSFKGTEWTPNDPRYNEQWHYHNTGQQGGTPDCDIDLPEAWEITRGNPEVIVAVIDEGIQHTHPDLIANMWEGIGYNFVNNSPNISPGDHGSHVAGTVAGVNNNGVGIAGVAGGSGPGDGVRLMSCQVFSGWSSGGFQNAPVYAADNGAAISQNSWGYTNVNYYDQSVLDAIDYFNVNGGGSAMVDGGITIFAAGNDNATGNWYPGCYSGTFAVAATTNQDVRSYYSNYGAWVDVSAPGGETISVTPRGVLSCWRNSNYGFYQGTSMACPHVSGTAALMISLAYGQLSPEQVADIIRNSTDDHYALNPGYTGQLGTGRLNAHQALLATLDQMILVNDPLAFTALATDHTSVNLSWVKNSENDDVMIVWSSTAEIGNPVQEQPYEIGDTIEGGGTVLYIGGENQFLHQGLSSNTAYYYKAFSLNDVPEYSPGITANATTLKDPITEFPYLQDFDGEEFPPLSWENKKSAGTGAGLWDRQIEGLNPDCYPHSGEAMARFNSDEYAAGTAGLLVSPPVMFGGEDYEVSFWLYRDTASAGIADRVDVFANITPTTGFATQLGTIHRSRTLEPVAEKEGWSQYIFTLPASYKNKMTYIILRGVSENGNSLFVDDFLIEVPVTCFPPENIAVSEITSGTAYVSWDAVAPASLWDIEYGLSGFEPGSGTLLSGIADTFTAINGLEPGTGYDLYVRGSCTEDDPSVWAGPAAFTTLCYAEVPWDEAFEGLAEDFGCWQVMENTAAAGGLNGGGLIPATDESWFVCTPDSFGGNGQQYIYEGEGSAVVQNDGENYQWLVSGELMLPADDQTDLAFRLYHTGGANAPDFYVSILSEGSWNTIYTVYSHEASSNLFERMIILNMDEFAGSVIRLAFVARGAADQPVAVDNISMAPASNYWTGLTDHRWNQSGNWRTGVPGSGETAIIMPSANTPVIDGETELEGIHIQPGGMLILAPDARVTISGELINANDATAILLQADETGNASLIHHSYDVQATVEYFSTQAQGLLNCVLISSPVYAQTFEPAIIGANDALAAWDEASASWISARQDNGEWNPVFEAGFLDGKAYLAGFDEDGIRNFKGVLRVAPVELELDNTGNGWYLLGNPYTAALHWDATGSALAPIAKLWNPATGSFADMMPGATIPAMSGIAVQPAGSESVSFMIDPEHRTHEQHGGTAIPDKVIDISVSEAQYETNQRTVIAVNPVSTEGYDNGMDSRFLKGLAPELYSLAGGEKLSLSTLPEVLSGTVIPLGFVKNDASEFTFSASFSNVYPGALLFLHDQKTGTIHNLTETPEYSFTAEADDDPLRFRLFTGTVGVVENPAATGVSIYASGTDIVISAPAALSGEARIYGLQGKTLYETRISGTTRHIIQAGQLPSGMVIVSFTGNDGITSRKVFLTK